MRLICQTSRETADTLSARDTNGCNWGNGTALGEPKKLGTNSCAARASFGNQVTTFISINNRKEWLLNDYN